MTDRDPNCTVLSIDGVGVFDLVSKRHDNSSAQHEPGGEAHPIFLQFYGHNSTHLRGDEEGTVHGIQQGEGGEQGDPLVPALFAMGQHQALQAVQKSLQPTETSMAFLDDVCVTRTLGPCQESRKSGTGQGCGQPIAPICSSSQTVNLAACGGETTRCRCTSRRHHYGNHCGASSFRGSPNFRESCRARDSSREDPSDARFAVCLNRTSTSRCVTTQESEGAWNSCWHNPVTAEVWQVATLQFSSGGLGLRNAERLRPTAYWASLADTGYDRKVIIACLVFKQELNFKLSPKNLKFSFWEETKL